MFTIRKADTADCQLINKLAWQVFPETYKDILTPAQIDYMMDWMYSPENIRKQMEEEGHVYLLAYEEREVAVSFSAQPEGEPLSPPKNFFVLPSSKKAPCGTFFPRGPINYIKEVHPPPSRMEPNVNRHNPALGFYQHMGMTKVREGDFPIGNGYYMNDYIMGMEI